MRNAGRVVEHTKEWDTYTSDHSRENLYGPDDLGSWSEKDRKWDHRKAQADDLAEAYLLAGMEKHAQRVHECAGFLRFRTITNPQTGEVSRKLKEAYFCHLRTCTVCQMLRSRMWLARFYSAIPALDEQFPGHRWVFLTLTIKNPRITDLRDTLKLMNKAWNKFRQRKEFVAGVLGWVRATEVSLGKMGPAFCHPHFHVLLMVPPSYFKGRLYIKHGRWQEMWAGCLEADYLPQVSVEKPRKGPVEILKYSTAPEELRAHPAWLGEYTRQTKHLRFLASGGALKDMFKEPTTDEELIHGADADEDTGEVDEMLTAFSWWSGVKRYRRNRRLDKPA